MLNSEKMSCFRKLSSVEVDAVHGWLRTMGMPVNRMIHRDYADGVLMAKLLKRIYPRLVELHNYEPRSSAQLKTANWETLNFKVFRRIGLPLCKLLIDSIVQSECGAVERLIWGLMNHTVVERPKQVMACSQKAAMQKSNTNVEIVKKPDSPCLSNDNSMTSFNSAHSNLNEGNNEKIEDENADSERMPPKKKSNYERELSAQRRKVAALEAQLRQRDNEIKTLMERVKFYEDENREFRKAFSVIFEEEAAGTGAMQSASDNGVLL